MGSARENLNLPYEGKRTVFKTPDKALDLFNTWRTGLWMIMRRRIVMSLLIQVRTACSLHRG